MQKFSSKDTSINVVNKIYKSGIIPGEGVILDYGEGKYDSNKEFMETLGFQLYVYDKYNRSEEHNREVMKKMSVNPPDYVVCSNVLNVIMEDDIIEGILRDISMYETRRTYIAIYEGDRSGKGRETSKGYQRNEKTSAYLPVVGKYFEILKCRNGIIECTARQS